MRFSNLIHHRRRKHHVNDKQIEETGSSSFFKDLTSVKVIDRIKKDRPLYTVDQEGNIKEIATSKIKKPKFAGAKKSYDFAYLNVAYYLVTPLLAGVFLGLGLDFWFKTKPFFFLFFLILGTLASFYNIFKLLKEK